MLRTIKGSVIFNANSRNDGTFQAVFEELSDRPLTVFMTSPYFRVGGGGMLAVPEDGDKVLASFDEETDEIYYQSTIVQVPPLADKDGYKDFQVVPKALYNTGGKPVKVTYQNALGAGLDITRNYDPTPGSKIATYVALKSEGGKRLALDDSPEIDALIVRNQHGDGLTITGDETDTNPDRTVFLKSNSSQYFTSFEGQMEFRVVDGRDIVLENNSTGSMSQTPSTDFWPNGPTEQPPKRYGGIYLRSENGDVSISSQADDGRIFIVTPKGRIQITEEGAIQIDAESDIQIRSSGNISLKATGDLKLEGASVDISSNGDFNVDGSTINLNTGSSQPPDIKEPLDLNDYNE